MCELLGDILATANDSVPCMDKRASPVPAPIGLVDLAPKADGKVGVGSGEFAGTATEHTASLGCRVRAIDEKVGAAPKTGSVEKNGAGMGACGILGEHLGSPTQIRGVTPQAVDAVLGHRRVLMIAHSKWRRIDAKAACFRPSSSGVS